MRERSDDKSVDTLGATESKKRVFGTELTNTTIKRNRVALPMDGISDEATRKQLLTEVKCENLENDIHCPKQEPGLTSSKKSYHFGPFAPPSLAQAEASEADGMKWVHDWESLASTYRPQYHNQGMLIFTSSNTLMIQLIIIKKMLNTKRQAPMCSTRDMLVNIKVVSTFNVIYQGYLD